MPRQKRVALKRLLDRAIEDIGRSQEHLVQVYEEFQPVHPEYAQYLEAAGKGMGEIAKVLAQFRDEVI